MRVCRERARRWGWTRMEPAANRVRHGAAIARVCLTLARCPDARGAARVPDARELGVAAPERSSRRGGGGDASDVGRVSGNVHRRTPPGGATTVQNETHSGRDAFARVPEPAARRGLRDAFRRRAPGGCEWSLIGRDGGREVLCPGLGVWMRWKRGWGRSLARARRGRRDVCRGKRRRVRAASRPTRGVSRNSIESIAPEGLLRRVDTFSRLAESGAAPAPTPAWSSTRAGRLAVSRNRQQSRQSATRRATRRTRRGGRDAADATRRPVGSALPLHRLDGLGRYQHACLGCPLRSSKRRHRVRVVCREANAGIVGKNMKTAKKTLKVEPTFARHGVRASRRRSRSVSFHSPPCVWDAVRRVRWSVSRVGERREVETRDKNAANRQKTKTATSLLLAAPPLRRRRPRANILTHRLYHPPQPRSRPRIALQPGVHPPGRDPHRLRATWERPASPHDASTD